MPHYYVSIPALDHKVFKYAGYVSPLNEESHRMAFEKFGPLGIDGGSVSEGPYKVITFDRYEGDRILEEGTLYGEQKYSPKELILTKRVDGRIIRMLWSPHSSPAEENKGFAYALTEGYMMHAFPMGDSTSWGKALEQHKEIEAHQKGAQCRSNSQKSK